MQNNTIFTSFLDKAIADLVEWNRSLPGEKHFHQRLMLICMCDIMHQARMCFEDYARKNTCPVERREDIQLLFDGKTETVLDSSLMNALYHVCMLYKAMLGKDGGNRIPDPLSAHLFYARYYQLYDSFVKGHWSLNDLVGYVMEHYPYHEIPDISEYGDIDFHPRTFDECFFAGDARREEELPDSHHDVADPACKQEPEAGSEFEDYFNSVDFDNLF